MCKNKLIFTHYWITGFGWENTIFQPNDFKTIELLGESKNNEKVFTGIVNGKHHILKGYYDNI